MKPLIDPKVDCVFKAMLGADDHKPLLIHFLNAVLQHTTGLHIQEVEILNPYNERDFQTDKLTVVDVKARDEAGRSYQVEIQLAIHAGLAARILYTWSTMYHGLLTKGAQFTLLKPVIAIWLLDESLFPLPGVYHLPFAVRNDEYGLLLSDHLRIHLLQLPQWQGQKPSYEELDRWMYLFTRGEAIDVDDPPAILHSKEMREAMQVLQHFAENEASYLLYQQRLEALSVEATWKAELERSKRETAEAKHQAEEAQRREEEAQRQAEVERQAREESQRREEAERQAREEAQRREEEAQQREEAERREKERLLALLKQAGIDPARTQDT